MCCSINVTVITTTSLLLLLLLLPANQLVAEFTVVSELFSLTDKHTL